MEIIRDLAGGGRPSPINVFYNTDDDADSATTRYKGSLCKLMDWNNAAGIQFTWAGESVTYENIAGILAEEVGANASTHNDDNGYLLNDASYGASTKKVYPLLPTSVVRAEYSQTDPAGTSNLDTNMTGTTTTITAGDGITTNDLMIGGWLYFTNGTCQNQLHYITDSASANTLTLATSIAGTNAATDDIVVVNPPHTLWMALDATYTNILSEVDDGSRTLPVVGLGTFISAPGIPYQRLDRDKHDGLSIANARFYHEFVIGGSATLGNVWRDTVVRA